MGDADVAALRARLNERDEPVTIIAVFGNGENPTDRYKLGRTVVLREGEAAMETVSLLRYLAYELDEENRQP